MEQFDPLPLQKVVRTIQDYQREILEVFEEGQEKRHGQVFYRTPWAIGHYQRAWQMDISEGYPSGVDVRAFMHEVRPDTQKLTEEISALNDITSRYSLPSRSSYKKTVQMELKSLPNPCSATNRIPFSRPAKSKGS